MTSTRRPTHPARAQGVRSGLDVVPSRLMSWLEEQLCDQVADAQVQTGGMSPGPAVRLRSRTGRRAFLKAVSSELNPDTPGLFRHEITVLAHLPAVPYRAGLQASYDDGTWVALLLDDVEGRHPDLSAPAEHALVTDLLERQADELTPPPVGLGLPALTDNAARWAERWGRLLPLAPRWVADRYDELLARVEALPDRLPRTTLCHWDVREDNLLVRPDGTAVVVDWGMARIGPRWADPLLLALNLRSVSGVAAVVRQHPGSEDVVVDTVLGLAGSQLVRSVEPAAPGLPTMRQFQASDATGLFALAQALLG